MVGIVGVPLNIKERVMTERETDERQSDKDAEGQRLAENEQEQPRTITEKVANKIEDLIPGDSDRDGH